MNRIFLLIVLMTSLSFTGFSQEEVADDVASEETTEAVEEREGDARKADNYFFNENYDAALEEYLLLLKEHPEDVKYNFNAGLCYLNSDFDRIKSIRYFEKVVFYDEEAATVYYMLGKAYQHDHQFDRAIDMFNKYIENYGPGEEYSIEEAELEIDYCDNAYQLLKFPKKVKFENLGPHINSEYPDYFPFVTVDESFLVYTSKRDDGSEVLPDGTYASNVYYTRVEDGEFIDGIHMPGADNHPEESEVVIGMSGDGERMLLMKGLESITGDIYSADFSNDHLEHLEPLSESINSKWREIAATYSEDGNTIYFVSDRPGGYGGTDIWIVKKLPIGKWGVPYNAGGHINTEFDEDFPNVSPDGDHLYFSSKGHFSMGGYDIFKAKWDVDSNAFISPVNLGYPVNSVDDDMNYRESKTGRYGYMSALREEGYGDYDIYRITIEDVESEYSVLRGEIASATEGLDVSGADITVTDINTGDLFGIYAPNPRTMHYVIILPPGEFEVLVESAGFEPVSFEVKILGKSSFQSEIDRDLSLIPK